MSVPTPENIPAADETPEVSPQPEPQADVPAPGALEPQADVPAPADPLMKVGDPAAPDYVEPLPTQASDLDELEADDVPDDIKRLLEEPNGPFALSSGTLVVIRPLKLREFLALLRIITRGASFTMGDLDLNFNDENSFVQTLLAMTLFAIPEAEDEVIVFVRTVIDPVGLNGDKEHDAGMLYALDVEMSNPEMEDAVDILAKVIAAEGADLHALGKRLATMWKVATKMGLTKGIGNKKTGAAS